MRIAFVWTGFTSYMADCWRELASRSDVDLRIWIEEQRKSDTAFHPDELMRGLQFSWDYSDQITDIELRQVEEEVATFNADVLFICGWSKLFPPFLAHSKRLEHVPKILEFDMPWEWTFRKILARFVLWPRIRMFKAAFVPGRSTARYAQWLGFKRIYMGSYCVDVKRFYAHNSDVKREGFVFVGRLVRNKNIRLLIHAYRLYRKMGGSWNLRVFGKGPENLRLTGIDGVELMGFVQTDELPSIYRSAGALLLPSTWEPWGQVLIEAMMCGCPVICSHVCGAREVVRAARCGRVMRRGCARDWARAMLSVEQRGFDDQPNREVLQDYTCEKWAERVLQIASDSARGDQ